MNPFAPQPVIRARALPVALLVLLGFFALVGLAVVGVTGYFRLSPDADALRRIALSSAGGSWNKVIALRVGWFTTGALRTGLSFVKMEPEARAALKVVRGAEVGVYELREAMAKPNQKSILARADKEMMARGWDRAVTVSKQDGLVVVYVSPSRFPAQNLKCCVLVLQERKLVVVSAQANLEPVLALALQHLQASHVALHPPARPRLRSA
ncbi:MAG: hypothetical protein WCT12_19500 [Verrucomicrobiota bacterium]